MITEPKIEVRGERYFVVIRIQAAVPFGKLVPPLHREVRTWLARKGLAPCGSPIIRYLTTDMSRKLDLELGWPVAAPVEGDGRVKAVVLPAGRYAVLTYTGSVKGKGLYDATVALLAWAEKKHITWKKTTIDGVEWWDARYEDYLTDPAEETDPKKWETELVFLTAEE
jgi:effector-binding domain-containing protein